MITYGRTSQDDSAHFRSSGSGDEYPRRRAILATEFQGVQEQDASPQARGDQPIYTTIEASVPADFPELSDHVPSRTMSDRMPFTGQDPVGLRQDSAKSTKRLNSQTSLPGPCFQKQNEPTLTDSSLSSKKKIRQDGGPVNLFLDELSIPVPMLVPSNAKSKFSKLTWTQQEIGELPADKPGSDEMINGLPAEQHKRRPSRSKSSHGDFGPLIPVNFSKRPEIRAKRKKNRRKTTAFERQVHDSEEDREIIHTTGPVVIIETRSNLESTLEAAENDSLPKACNDRLPEAHDAESGAKSVPSKKRGRPRKQVPESTEELDAPNSEAENLLELPKPRLCSESSLNNPLRKKRKASPEPTPRSVSDSESYDEDIEAKNDSRDRNTVLKELKDNSNLHLPSPSPSTKCTSGTLELPSPAKVSIPPQTPQKPVKGPDKHSPLASGKVAYRVGLSKKARIEPLLRIVKK